MLPLSNDESNQRNIIVNTTALVLYGIFALIGFGWRTWIQWRRTGDTGLRLHAKPGSIQWLEMSTPFGPTSSTRRSSPGWLWFPAARLSPLPTSALHRPRSGSR